MNTEKISFYEAIALITVVMLDKIILNTPKQIIATVGSAAWINVIYISILAILIGWFISFLFKKFQGKDLLDVSEFLGGTTLKIIIGILSLGIILLILSSVLRIFSETLHLIYFRTSPYIYVVLFFLIGSTIANRYSIKVIAKANLIIIPIVILSIIVVLTSSIKNFIPQRIFPILGYGANETFFSGLTNLYSFSGIFYLFFLNPFISKTKEFKKISIVSIIISALCLILSVTCLLLSLSFTFNNSEMFSLYLLSRDLEFGRFLQRIDAIFIFIWIISTISYLSIGIYFCIYIFKKTVKISNTTSINYSFTLLILITQLIPSNISFFANKLSAFIKNSSLIIIYFISILILILANLKLYFINKKKGKYDELHT